MKSAKVINGVKVDRLLSLRRLWTHRWLGRLSLSVIASVASTGFTASNVFAQDAGQSTVDATAAAPYWPQFRGGDANPISDNPALPQKWSMDENIRWSAEVPGRGWSSPIVVGDRVFLTTVVTDGQSKQPQTGTEYSNQYVKELMDQGLSEEEVEKKVMERDFELPDQVSLHYYLICYDRNNGQELWRHQYHEGKPPGGRHRKNSFASETPVTDGTHLYVYATHIGLFAYTLDGQPVWQRSLENHPIYMEFGTGASPVLVDGRLIVVDDNQEHSTISAFDTKSGQVMWQVDREVPEDMPMKMLKSGWSTPYVWRHDDKTEIVTTGPGRAVSYDLDGKELWRFDGLTPAPSASSFAVGPTLYLNGGRGKPIFAISAGASGDISLGDGERSNQYVTWMRERTGTYIPTPVVYKNSMFIIQDNGIAIGMDLESGKVQFKERLGTAGKADFTASPWAYNDHVFFASEQGDVFVIKAGDEFDLVQVNHLGELIMASPALVEDQLLLRTDKHLLSIGVQ